MSKGTLQLRDVKKGDRFWERDGGRAALYEALESARECDATSVRFAGFELWAKRILGDDGIQDESGRVLLFQALESHGYGLDLYREQELETPTQPQPDLLYGLKDWEQLEDSVEEVVEKVFEDHCEEVGEGEDVTAGRLNWPLEILVFKRMDVGGEAEAQRIASDALERTLERLDEEYGDPDGDTTDATDAMKEAALVFGRAVVAEYVPWQCEPTGEVIKVTREEAMEKEGNASLASLAKQEVHGGETGAT